MVDRTVYTIQTTPDYSGPVVTLGDILIPDSDVPGNFFIDEKEVAKWEYAKGGKRQDGFILLISSIFLHKPIFISNFALCSGHEGLKAYKNRLNRQNTNREHSELALNNSIY